MQVRRRRRRHYRQHLGRVGDARLTCFVCFGGDTTGPPPLGSVVHGLTHEKRAKARKKAEKAEKEEQQKKEKQGRPRPPPEDPPPPAKRRAPADGAGGRYVFNFYS